MLLDTGAGEPQTAAAVDGVVKDWLRKRQSSADSYELIVAHTHAHDDHTAGDEAFRVRAHTTVIPLTVEGTRKAFAISHWPSQTGSIDLGGRAIQVIPIPGHDPLSLAYYDARTGVLLTGDTLYPGRLYVADFPGFVDSIERLVSFTAAKPISHVLGNHIEQASTPFLDYPVGTRYQPDEHEFALSRGSLLELRDALAAMAGRPARLALRDFTIWPKEAAVTQSASSESGDEVGIRDVVRKYMDARDRQDAVAIEMLFVADADQLVSSGEWRKGREEVVRGTLASSQGSGGKRTIGLTSIRFLSPDVAIADGHYELTGLAGGANRSMWTTLTVKRTPEGWRIAAIRNMLPAPPIPAK